VVRYSTLSRLSQVTEDQWGLVTRRQAELAGVSRATLQRLASEGILERVAHGVYQLAGAPRPDQLELKAAWLQLEPEIPAWERTPEHGVVSHRSAAAVYGLSHLPADRHDFTLPTRRQSRRPDVRLHQRPLRQGEWVSLHSLPVTRPARTASDLLDDKEDPEAVAHVAADAIRAGYDHPGTFAGALARYAVRFGLRRGDGLGLLRWLLDLVGDPDTPRWMEEAQAHPARASSDARHLDTVPVHAAERRV
jgi:predicted transcriptional regulator of viral defense system